MPRSYWMLISLFTVLTTAQCFGQTPEEFGIQRLPSLVDQSPLVPQSQAPGPAASETLLASPPLSFGRAEEESPVASLSDFLGYRYSTSLVDESPQIPPAQPPGPTAGEIRITGEPISLDGSPEGPPVASLGDFLGYRYLTSSLDWIPGGGDQFGAFSIVSDHYQKSGISNGIGIGMGFHFLAGPKQTDMPPRVYDFSIAYQIRERLGPLRFDLAASVLAASDFEGSARKGILFPSHAVGYLNVSPMIDVVFGVDYLDRGDIKLLPVAGLIWTANPEMRFELVFPRPRAVFQLSDRYRLYLAGELGGGSWAIERVDLSNDLATYRDLRVCIGIESVEKGGERLAFEIGYLFDRSLEYTSGNGDMHLDDAVILRLVTRY